MREIASLRTYLLWIGASCVGARSLQGQGVSDLVDSVLGDALALVRENDGRLTDRSSGELKTWLANRLRWACWDAARRDRKLDAIIQGLPARPRPPTPSSDAARREEARLLTEARAKLDPKHRQLIEWREDEELTFEEIGRRRGCSTSYARRACLEAQEALGSICRGLARDRSP